MYTSTRTAENFYFFGDTPQGKGYAVSKKSTDYIPFGQVLPNRNGNTPEYRYGFNSMEKDDELKGNNNSYDFGARMLDPRIGRWLSIDPLNYKQPDQSPYKAFFNCPIFYTDDNGETEYQTIVIQNEKGEVIRKYTRVVSNNLISGGDYDDEDGANISGGYDYRSVRTLTINDAGEVIKVTNTTNEILYHNGVKDKEYFFTAKKKGVIYSCDTEGSGGTQNGGFKLVTKSGGASPTKQKSLTRSEERNIEDLLTYTGAAGQGLTRYSGKLKEIINNLKCVEEERQAINPPTDGGSSNDGNEEESTDKGVVVVEPAKSQSGKPTTITSTQSKKQASTYVGTYNKNKDTLWVGGKK